MGLKLSLEDCVQDRKSRIEDSFQKRQRVYSDIKERLGGGGGLCDRPQCFNSIPIFIILWTGQDRQTPFLFQVLHTLSLLCTHSQTPRGPGEDLNLLGTASPDRGISEENWPLVFENF